MKNNMFLTQLGKGQNICFYVKSVQSTKHQNLLVEQQSLTWVKGYIHRFPHTNEVSHKRNLLCFIQKVNNHKKGLRRMTQSVTDFQL